MFKRLVGTLLACMLLANPLLGATGTIVPTVIQAGGLKPESTKVPVSIITDWATVCDAPTTSDNSGSTVVNPGGISRSNQNWLQMAGVGTTVQFRLRYPTAGTVSTQVVVQPFGRDSAAVPERLVDTSGTHVFTLTVDTTNDARDGTYSYTQPYEVDANANKEVLIAVKTALAGTSLTNAVIQARLK